MLQHLKSKNVKLNPENIDHDNSIRKMILISNNEELYLKFVYGLNSFLAKKKDDRSTNSS